MEPELKKTKEEWLRDLDAAIARGLADSEAGRIIPAEDVFAELEAKFQQMIDEENQSKSNPWVRHPCAGRDPASYKLKCWKESWMPAYAGMTVGVWTLTTVN